MSARIRPPHGGYPGAVVESIRFDVVTVPIFDELAELGERLAVRRAAELERLSPVERAIVEDVEASLQDAVIFGGPEPRA